VNVTKVGKKKDIQQVEAVAKEFNMDESERRDFGDFLEEEKASVNREPKMNEVTLLIKNYNRKRVNF